MAEQPRRRRERSFAPRLARPQPVRQPAGPARTSAPERRLEGSARRNGGAESPALGPSYAAGPAFSLSAAPAQIARQPSSVPPHRPPPGGVAVGPAGGPAEREADQVAEQVATPAVPAVQTCPECGGTCGCGGGAGGGAEEELPVLQRLPAPVAPAVGGAPPARGPVGQAFAGAGGGETLRPSLSHRLERHLGTDLSRVRVHSGGTAESAARALGARAFTVGRDIWLGAGESPDDLRLMAHEATHVVQQGQDGGAAAIQRKPADYRHPEDGGGVESRLQERFATEIGDEPAEEAPEDLDRSEVRRRTSEVRSETRPDVDRPAAERPRVEQSEAATRETADTPAEPLAEAEEGSAEEAAGEGAAAAGPADQATAAAGRAAGLAEQAFAAASAEPEPQREPEVAPVEPVAPVDRAGEPLADDPETEARVEDLTARIQDLRAGGLALRAQAAEERGNASILRGNLARVGGEIESAQGGIDRAAEHTAARREITGQAEAALGVSEEKAATVASQAPEFTAKADEGKEDTGPMSSEASELSAENRANTPDDEEAAADAREQGGKIDSVGNDSVTMDDAVSRTREKATTLAADAARANQLNTQSRGRITETTAQLDRTEERIGTMREQTGAAREQVEALASAPETVRSRADAFDAQAAALIAASHELEARLQGAQESYRSGMEAVPPLKPWQPEPGEEQPGEAPLVQRQPEPGSEAEEPEAGAGGEEAVPVPGEEEAAAAEALPAGGEEAAAAPAEGEPEAAAAVPATGEGRYDERAQVDVTGALPGWLTGIDQPSAEEREEARLREEERRQNEVAQIEELADGRFEDLGAADKVGIALRLVGQNFYNSIANIRWPGAGGLARMLLDPRSMLAGVTSGLSMMLSGAAGLFSAEQWSRDPLGNLLKSAADIATGLTIVLGSITALAGVVAAIMGALILVTFGFAAPIALPVISVCATIITTVGGWTLAVGKIALVLQALSLIKNLIDAATAESAEDLQNQADQIRADTVAAGTVVLTIAGTRGAAAGIRRVRSRALRVTAASRRAGGARALAARTARALPGRVAAGAQAVGRGITRGAAAVGRGVTAVGRGAVRGAQAVGRGLAGGARAVGRGARAVGRGVRGLAGRARQRPLARNPAVGASRAVRFGRGRHTLSIRQIGVRIALFICTTCGEFLTKIDELLGKLPGSGAARRQLLRLRRQVHNLNRRIQRRRVSPERANEELADLERRMATINRNHGDEISEALRGARPQRRRRGRGTPIGGSAAATPREVARQRGLERVRRHKQGGIGQAAGRSGGHGEPYKRAGAELIREANQLPRGNPLRAALKVEGQRLIQQGKAISHRGER